MTREEFFGNDFTWSSHAVDVTLNPTRARLQVVNPSVSGRKAILPDARRFQKGGPILFVRNAGGFSISLANASGATTNADGKTIGTVAVGQTAIVLLGGNDTENGDWYSIVR